ncbi:hypothetical protein JHD49_08300 [Sulfurimonas sp. SAG-AH-194-C21]|nr:hypothetical protein [Sulfurimonas sp. SAG-AH-194-C21]MDF1883935.1 hypothetical protein [Sulfurimonas sp. SAG-AH-194-C21]
MTSISQLYLLKYKDFAFEFNEDLEIYELDILYINEFKSGFLLSNNEQLITNILAVLPSVKLKNINEFDMQIKTIIQMPLQTLRDDSTRYASNFITRAYSTLL